MPGNGSVSAADSTGLSSDARDAWRCSVFGRFPDRAQSELLLTAREIDLDSGDVLEPRASDPARRQGEGPCALVVGGLLRTYVMSGSRQVTLRYLGPEMVVGVPGAIARLQTVDAQAVSDTRLLMLSSLSLVRLAQREPAVAWELARYLSACVFECVETLSGNVFLPVRRRVARHLLELATREDARVIVRATTQDIADATGTVREVVSRTMRALREEGFVSRDGEALVLPDLGALHQLADGVDPPIASPSHAAFH